MYVLVTKPGVLPLWGYPQTIAYYVKRVVFYGVESG